MRLVGRVTVYMIPFRLVWIPDRPSVFIAGRRSDRLGSRLPFVWVATTCKLDVRLDAYTLYPCMQEMLVVFRSYQTFKASGNGA